MVVELRTAEKYRNTPEWPMRLVRAATYEDTPFSTLSFSKVLAGIKDYVKSREAHGISASPAGRADENILGVTSPERIKSLVTSLYNEGAALANVLGDEAVRVKLSHLTPAELDAELKKFGSVPNMLGFHHVKEFFDATTKQAQASLLHEEGAIDKAAHDAVMQKTNQMLARTGHYGVHVLAEENPAIREFLLNDARPIVASHAKGRETFGISSISNFTRAAYIRSEEAHAARFSEEFRQRNSHEAIHRSMGKEYEAAFSQKWDAVSRGSAGYEFARDKIEIPNSRLIPAMSSATHVSEVEGMLAARQSFIGKHALALLDPKTIEALEKSGKYDPAFWQALDQGMHDVIGSNKPFAPHIAAAAARQTGAAHTHPHPSQPVGEGTKSLPAPDETQKKTPKGAGPSASATEPPKPSTEPKHASSAKGSSLTEAPETMIKRADHAHPFIVGRLTFSLFAGMAILDGWTKLRPTQGNANAEKESSGEKKPLSFARVAEVSIGAAVLAASWLVKDKTIDKLIIGRGK